jgi:hypothetical protein
MVRSKTLSWGLNSLMALDLALGCGTAHGGPLRAIELVDGSIIVGEILSADHGTYTVGTTTFGTVTLKDSDIHAITAREVADPHELSGALSKRDAQTLEIIQQRILADPQIANSLNALKDAPEMQQVLQDPDIMDAIRKGDLEYLKANPRIGELMRNPTVQDLYKNLEQ